MTQNRNNSPVTAPRVGPSNSFRISCFGFRAYRGAIHWAVLTFLLAFAALLVLLTWYYLLPAGQAARVADPHGRAQLRAVSTLLLAVVLFVLLVGLILTFRVGRFFFPRPPTKPAKTQYVDAWAESAKRMKTPPVDRPKD